MSEPFFVIRPNLVTDSNFVSSNIAENDHAVYSAATTYALGARVIVTTGHHKIYESLVANNLNNFPPTSPDQWLEVGPTNRWAAFDSSGGTRIMGSNTIEFSVTGNRLGSLALLEIDALSVRIRASTALDGTYYDKTYPLPDLAVVSNWYEYLYQPIQLKREVIVNDIPPITGSTYTVTVTGNGPISLGTFVIGNRIEFGFTQYNASIGIIDYSRKEADEFGRQILVKRAFSKRMDVRVYLEAGNTDAVARLLADLRATVALYVAANNTYDSLTILGFYRDFSIDIAFPTQTIASLQIESIAT